MKKCFGYVRVSTVKQGEGVSLEAQREAIEQFAARSDITIVRWFEERVTAAKSGRPVFTGMLRLLKRRRADGVVMHKIDRSARNFADWAKIGALSDAGIDVHFASESLDFRSRGGRLAADIQAVIAADYIRNLREETMKGINGRLRQGLYPFKAPIGYVDNGKGRPKTIDPARAPLVRQAFELYASGNHSFLSLTAEMKRRGLVNYRGRALTKGGIEKVLRNPFYFGLIRITTTGDTYPGIHQPIISAAIFERVQELRSGKSGKKVTKHRFAYRGLFRCLACGNTMTGERQAGHVYYRCHVTGCPTTCVREEAITTAMVDMLSGLRLDPIATTRLHEAVETFLTEEGGRIGSLELSLGQVESRLQRLADAFIDNMVDEDTYQARRQSLLTEKLRLTAELENERTARDQTPTLAQFFEHVNSLKNMFISANSDERREIVEITTSKRTVNGKNVGVEPAKWLSDTCSLVSAYSGDPHRPAFRRHLPADEQEVRELIKAARSSEAKRFERLFHRSDEELDQAA